MDPLGVTEQDHASFLGWDTPYAQVTGQTHVMIFEVPMANPNRPVRMGFESHEVRKSPTNDITSAIRAANSNGQTWRFKMRFSR